MIIQSFNTVGRIVFGNGALASLGDEIKRLGGSRAFIVTDPGIRAAGLLDNMAAALDGTGIDYQWFTEVEPDPGIGIVDACAADARDFAPDVIIGFGGGSALDISKVVAILLTNTDPVDAYFGMELVQRPGIPLILVPTTAGTGSEVTSICVLTDTENNVKKGIVSEHLFAKTALLDPQLTRGLPPHITAYTGLDALIHAIESYTGKQSTYLTRPLALEAIRLVARHLRTAYADGTNLEAREGMLQASLLAGLAFSNTQTAAAHACALSLGARFHLPHGVATSLMLPAAMRFNAIAVPEQMSHIAEAFGMPLKGLSPMEKAARAIDAVINLIQDIGFNLGIKNYGVTREDIPGLAAGAMVAVRLWNNNPRNANEKDVQKIFEDSFRS